jgi:4-hydroxy-3-polyprenylbenzoate decarboxylase
MSQYPIIIGISGASGACYGIKALELLKSLSIETHLILTKTAELTIGLETGLKLDYVKSLASETYSVTDLAARPSSGSFRSRGMIIAPCSIRSLSEITTGVTSNLLTRSADVCLKEKRRLVLMVRETPLHSGHLRSMADLSDRGAVIAPPVPAFYNNPQSLDDCITHSVGRVLDLFDIDHHLIKRWKEKHG